MKPLWTSPAERDVQGIHDHIAEDNPAAARRTVAALRQRSKAIGLFPQMGRKVPEEDDPNLRELIEGRYRIVYRIEAERCLIVAVLDAALQWREGK